MLCCLVSQQGCSDPRATLVFRGNKTKLHLWDRMSVDRCLQGSLQTTLHIALCEDFLSQGTFLARGFAIIKSAWHYEQKRAEYGVQGWKKNYTAIFFTFP